MAAAGVHRDGRSTARVTHSGRSPYDAGMHEPLIHVACLCAAWCRVCDEYAPLFAAVAAEQAAAHGRVVRHWIDIEDEAELLGDFDVETFPTVVVVGPEGVRFAGALTPHKDVLRKVLRSTLGDDAGGAGSPAAAPAVESFARRLRQRSGGA